jgi:hypothetical protein
MLKCITHCGILQGVHSEGFSGWEFLEVRPFLEHALICAACNCCDYEGVPIARSIFSRGRVTLKPPNHQKMIGVDSIVFGLLFHEVASRNALVDSHALV